MQNPTELNSSLTINEVIALHPETIRVFNHFGLDTCCGGGDSIEAAARQDGVDVAAVLAALQSALDPT